MQQGTKIGFIGLGAMGFGMAASLCRAGFAVAGHDLREEALARLVERGGGRAATPEGAARGVQLLFVMVLNDAQAFAHTSPVYVHVGTTPVWNDKDAAFWVDWIDQLVSSVQERGVFASPERRDTVVRLFRSAQDVYRRGPAR